jgi:transglutaminase-like putative cysteine protease
MRELVRKWRVNPDMVSAARSIVYLQPPKDDAAEAAALFRFVQGRVRYVRDVHEVETLATPGVTLDTLSGDCDDHATLLATLLEAIGFPTRFVVTGYSEPGVFEHVYLQVFVNGPLGSEWVACDSTEPYGFGWEAPDAVAMMIEGS